VRALRPGCGSAHLEGDESPHSTTDLFAKYGAPGPNTVPRRPPRG